MALYNKLQEDLGRAALDRAIKSLWSGREAELREWQESLKQQALDKANAEIKRIKRS